MIWNCVEDRIDDGSKYGRVSRKIIFGNIYADKTAVLSRNPIPVDAHTHLKVRNTLHFTLNFNHFFLDGRQNCILWWQWNSSCKLSVLFWARKAGPEKHNFGFTQPGRWSQIFLQDKQFAIWQFIHVSTYCKSYCNLSYDHTCIITPY